MFEVFREDNVPECENVIETPDIFNTQEEIDEEPVDGEEDEERLF